MAAASAKQAAGRVLTVLTWNIEANLSAQAPSSFKQSTRIAMIQKEILDRQPDLLFLQEFGAEYVGSLGGAYRLVTQARSHCGLSSVLVRVASGLEAKPSDCLADASGVALADVLLPGGGPSLFVAGCHLAPFATGAGQRAEAVAEVLHFCPPPAPLLLAGDMNMREAETAAAHGVDGVTDAWIAAGRPGGAKFTWDAGANDYFGSRGTGVTIRFDRVFCRGFTVEEFALVGNTPVPGLGGCFLSDHYGIWASLKLK
jgi:endonuclease/exonuclease/phosphatase family metal-dependent hydrolase